MRSVIGDLLSMMDEGKCSIQGLLNLRVLPLTLVHHTLIEDLMSTGIEGNALEYLPDYLTDRKYRERIGNSSSESALLTRGTPK